MSQRRKTPEYRRTVRTAVLSAIEALDIADDPDTAPSPDGNTSPPDPNPRDSSPSSHDILSSEPSSYQTPSSCDADDSDSLKDDSAEPDTTQRRFNIPEPRFPPYPRRGVKPNCLILLGRIRKRKLKVKHSSNERVIKRDHEWIRRYKGAIRRDLRLMAFAFPRQFRQTIEFLLGEMKKWKQWEVDRAVFWDGFRFRERMRLWR